jgi:signal recognition particle receptor subunit beta
LREEAVAEIHEEEKRMTLKFVYYGPALSGKTTNLMQLHDLLNPTGCGELMSFETKGDRTIFFDFLPVTVKSESGFKIKIKLFTVPGQVSHDATRKAVLSRADAVVFVADSQKNQSMSNFESFDNLEKNVGRVGLDFENLPLVIQFNKRDLNSIISKAEVLERWCPTGLPVTFSSAIYGKGVKETFEEILKRSHKQLEILYRIKSKYAVVEEDFLTMAQR